MAPEPNGLQQKPNEQAIRISRNEKPPRHKLGEKFLKGPIPWNWLVRAARQPGKSLHVSVALWHLVGLKKSGTVALSNKLLVSLGISRFAGYRALQALENAGLVTAIRHRGRNPIVTVLTCTPEAEVPTGKLDGLPPAS